jgi:hypothetical protein
MDTVKAMVPSGFCPSAKDATKRNKAQNKITRDLFFISVSPAS